MRFKTFGLYVRSSLVTSDENDGTWCKIEFPAFIDNQSNILSLDIRLVLLSIRNILKYFILMNILKIMFN